jgi:hypothetical protein
VKRRLLPLAVPWASFIIGACSSEAHGPAEAGDGAEPAGNVDQDADGSASSPSRDGGVDGSDEPDATTRDAALNLPTNDAGCLTYAAAQKVCGFGSDGAICKFAAQCAATADKGQCKVNCEMQSTITCLSAADAQCLIDATETKSCAALSACKWKL